ncbi:O-antigen polymerase [Streptococcus sobrinus]|uniref:O-antigen polymerase n=1 Tax=Streptococcus sobrinus TaxID=1310 RepID=UPI0002F51AD0|nr:O-antigen polymerase [Streptococcus sobrinus]
MLYIIVVIVALFAVLNFIITDGDWLDPAVIFSGVFLMQIMSCLLATSYLHLVFHVETVLILLIALSIFTLFSFWNHSKVRNSNVLEIAEQKKEFYPFMISKMITFLFIVLAVIVIYLKYKYLNSFASAYGQGGLPLSKKISLFDAITKFYPRVYKSLGVFPSSLLSNLELLVRSFAYLTAFSLVGNWIVNRKLQLQQLLYLFLFTIVIYFGGSRSGIFRLFTFMIFIFYILLIRNGANRTVLNKSVRKIIVSGVILVTVFLSTMSLFGRASSTNIFHYLFVYIGAPLYNLDSFIQTYQLPRPEHYFGSQTFWSFYSWYLPKLHMSTYKLDLPFVNYDSNYGLGNVYTTFYQFIYDFGFIGVAPLTAIFSWYYTGAYRKIRLLTNPSKVFDYRLIVYAFLFNDLFMLFFSNRFYETVTNFGNVKFLLCVFIMGMILEGKGFRIGKFNFKLKS